MSKKISNVEVRLHNLTCNNVIATSALSVGDPINSGSVQGDAPARPAIFDAPVTSAPADNSGTIWQ